MVEERKNKEALKHFRYIKVTPEISLQMKQLRQNGLTQDEIAQKLGVSQNTVCYHLNDDYRENKIEKEKQRQRTQVVKDYQAKRRVSKKGRKWMREYIHERYTKDLEFRRKMIRANSGGKFREQKL